MCNAWNHDPTCRCGWGGEGHLGRPDSDSKICYIKSIPPIYTKYYDTFLNPNAKCPVCGKPVFFYQSPAGGRVFFDELGPPWPKHPCTIHKQKAKPVSGMPVTGAVPTDYSWGVEGWEPFLGVSSEKGSNQYLAEGYFKKRKIYLSFSLSSLKEVNKKKLNSALWMAKPLGGNNYSVSICYGSTSIETTGTLEPFPHKKRLETKKVPFLSQKLGNVRFDIAGVDVICTKGGMPNWISITTLLKEYDSKTSLRNLSKVLKKTLCNKCKKQKKCERHHVKINFVDMNKISRKFYRRR